MWEAISATVTLIGVGGLLLYYAYNRRKIMKAMDATGTTKISEITPGVREVSGKLVAINAPLKSPITGRECVYYQFKVQQTEHSSSSNRTRWATMIKDEKACPFVVEDGTGKIRVDVDKGEVLLNKQFETKTGAFDPASPEVERLLRDRYSQTSKSWIPGMNKTMRYEEKILQEGDTVYALGTAICFSSGDPLLVKRGTPLIVSTWTEPELRKKLRGEYYLAGGSGLAMIVAWVVMISFFGFDGI